MDTDTYPGKGLSPSQLVFALSKELSHITRLPLFTLKQLSKLERDISSVLTTVRESRNSLAPINRLPLDVLSLIPTHLPSQQDRFRTTFVCRHWRRIFLQHATLWSQLFTKKGEDYVATLLERAKGSALDIVIDRNPPSSTISLLLPHTRRIKHLMLPGNHWPQIFALSQAISGPLPLLRTLKISINDSDDPLSRSNLLAAPSPLFFSGAVNLEEFDFEPESAGSLKNFVFPNLTAFKLSNAPIADFNISDLFDFLKASPTLQTVEVRICSDVVLEEVPRDLVVLPNVKTFFLSVYGAELQVYEPVTHISCPHATYTSLEQHIFDSSMTHGMEVFPNPVSCKTIVHQYSTSPVEEVTLEIGGYQFMVVATYSLTFESSNAAVIRFDFELGGSGRADEELHMSHEEMNVEIFTQACRTIRSHPLLSHLKRLHIKDGSNSFGIERAVPMADVVWELFGSLGPLDELTIQGLDLRLFLTKSRSAGRVFPPVKELTMSEKGIFDDARCMDAIVELAESQYRLEKPFDRVTIRAKRVPAVNMAGRLGQWVGAVDCYELLS